MSKIQTLKVGDRVKWVSQALGNWRLKVGKVVEVVKAGKAPESELTGSGWGGGA